MFTKSFFAIFALALVLPEQALARERWLERNGKAVLLHPRRFGQESPAIINKLSGLCPGQVCGNLAGSAISTLLAASPECAQQDKADEIIDASRQFDAATQAAMIAAAKEFRAAEKNTPPDFTTNPPTPRNSVFCQKAPKNSELNGIVQAQDPANGDVFFDPATKASVQRGQQPNTFPFGTAGSSSGSTPAADSANTAVVDTSSTSAAAATATNCAPDVTVTVTVSAATETAAATTSAAAAAATNGAVTVGSADFGSCSVPQIEFATGFDNRRETSFQPVDRTSYNHGSAQNIDLITRAMCDQLTNTCKANQAAKDLCQQATAAADTQPAKTGGQADAFNKVFGIDTDFAAVQQVDDQGRPVGTPAAATGNAAAATTVAAPSTAAAAATSPAAAATASAGTSAGGIGNFGKCTVPEIEFATGFDNRRETSFRPVDRTSYPHDSAQNGAIITQFICDTLVNTCGADQTARDTCQTARAAFDAATPLKSGAQADAFNAVFGKVTNFKAVAIVDNQGNVVSQ